MKSNYLPLKTKKSFGQPDSENDDEDDIEKNRCQQCRCNGRSDSLAGYYG
jgi:hypothetical protein